MTAEIEEDHEISPSFVWDGKYEEQLRLLAETDEMTEEIVWPPLKDAIKHLLHQTFQRWPSSSAPILHPAAALIPLQSQDQSLDGTDASHSLTIHTGTTSNGHAVGMSNGAAQHEQEESGEQRTSEAADELALDDRFRNAEELDDNSLANDFSSVKEADMQAFFPSKRQAPAEWKGSWGRRIDSEEELQAERKSIFTMLDDFENQPPFTIQRLAELVLHPTDHHHTLPKFIAALKRILSVTATRDAFPAHAGEEEEEEEMDGIALENVETNGAESASTVQAIRRRGSSVPGSPRTAPLFSPIPFLMRSGDEGMPRTAGVENRVDVDPTLDAAEPPSTSSLSNEYAMTDQDVPRMELGGADRTTEHAIEEAERTGKGAGSTKAGAELTEQVHETEKDDVRSSSQSVSAADAVSALPPREQNMHANVEEKERRAEEGESTHTPASSIRLGANEPLGVPPGPVDEVDQVGEKHGQLKPVEPGAVAGGARAFSSTTSSLPIKSMDEDTQANKQPAEQSGERALKRIRSERNLAQHAAKQDDDH